MSADALVAQMPRHVPKTTSRATIAINQPGRHFVRLRVSGTARPPTAGATEAACTARAARRRDLD